MTATIALLIIIAISAGLMPAFLAARKGRRFINWWIYGALAFPVAIVHAFLLGGIRLGGGYRSCGFCRTKVKISSPNCPRCGHEFVDF